MAPPRFRTSRRKLAPWWLTEGEAELVGYSLDLLKDAFLERLRQGLLARFPQQDANGTPSPPDALAAQGRDRRVIRGLGESDRSYAARLKLWLDDRRTAGNPFALMQKLAEYTGAGVMFRTVDNRGNWFTRTALNVRSYLFDQGNWDWDGAVSKWSRFWTVIYPGTLWAAGWTWGDSTWGDTTQSWGSTATVDEVATMRFIPNDGWKPGGRWYH